MTPNTNKSLLCKELSKMISAYPALTVKELTQDTHSCQNAYYKAIQTVSSLINTGDTSGAVTTKAKLNIESFSVSLYQWDDFDCRQIMISSTPETFSDAIQKVENLKATNSITKILVGGFCKTNEQYYYFDLKGNAYSFEVDVKKSKSRELAA